MSPLELTKIEKYDIIIAESKEYIFDQRYIMQKDEAMEWVLREMEKLTPEHFKKTEFTLAELRWPAFDRTYKCYVVLPVDIYERGEMGYEIMPVRILAENCPWDMNRTIVKIDTENTHIEDNLHDIVVEDAELHAHLKNIEYC